MEDLETEKEIKSRAALLFDRLDIVAIHAEGFFLRKAIAQNEKQRDALAQIFRRKPNSFRELVVGSGMYRLTQDYLSQRRIFQFLKSHDDSGREPLRRALWSLFLIEHGFTLPFKDDGQVIERIHHRVDNFKTDHAGFNGIIITVPQRSDRLKAQSYVSPLITGKLVRRGLDRYLSEFPEISETMSVEEIIRLNLLPGGIWPRDEDDCHDDQRKYPLWKVPVSGRAKWKADRENLQTGKFIPGYKFGVYPKWEE